MTGCQAAQTIGLGTAGKAERLLEDRSLRPAAPRVGGRWANPTLCKALQSPPVSDPRT